jgi:hypothetical protein
MDTGCMSTYRVLDQEFEEEMLPPQLAEELLRRTREARLKKVPVNIQYREIQQTETLRKRASKEQLDDSMVSIASKDVTGYNFEEILDVDLAD